MSLRAAVLATAALLVAISSIVLLLMWPDSRAPATATAPPSAPSETSGTGRTIKARLFYVSDEGDKLASVERDVPFAEGPEQAREIVAAQIGLGPPLVSATPPGAMLRAVYVTDRGDAYVDLSREAVTAHPGGTLDELLTIYSIVNALTVNLPGVHRVQILIDGKEVETLAGHVDLRQPLGKNLALVQ